MSTNIFFSRFLAFYFLKVYGIYIIFSKIKSHKEVTKQEETKFFLLVMLDEGYGSGAGSVSLTNGSGSGRPIPVFLCS
jgi:hypothetical protein